LVIKLVLQTEFQPIKCLTDIGINHPVMNAYRKGEITSQNHGFCQQRRTWKHNDLEITRIIISMTTLLLEWKVKSKKMFFGTISSWSKSWSAWFFLSFLTSLLTTLKKRRKLTGSLNEIDLKFYFQRFMITQITIHLNRTWMEMKTDFYRL
jgi:hypothetical protein